MLKFIKENVGKIGGGVFGFLVALLLIIAWPIILIIFLVFLGILLGGILDITNRTRRWMDTFFTHRDSSKDQR